MINPYENDHGPVNDCCVHNIGAALHALANSDDRGGLPAIAEWLLTVRESVIAMHLLGELP